MMAQDARYWEDKSFARAQPPEKRCINIIHSTGVVKIFPTSSRYTKAAQGVDHKGFKSSR